MPHQVLSLWIRRQPIKIKLVLIILLTCIVALLLEGVAFTVYERIRVKEDMARDLDSLARIIADRNTAALSFNDDRVARETLAALKVKPVVVAACIYDADGKVFARYDSGAEPSFAFPASLKADRQTLIEDGHLHLLEPVVMDGQVLGKVFIRASLKELDQFWLNFLLFAWLIIFLTALVSVWLAARVQRIVSLPLEQLTHTAQAITEQKDYGLRATHSSDDEVGTLVHAFNDMLETIESRNRELLAANGLLAHSQEALRATNESLEQRVAERTAELQALFDSAGVGIMLMKDRRIERCNRRMDEMFGYACGEQIGLSTRIWYLDDGAWQEAGAALSRRIWLGETHVREQAVQHRDGSPFWVRMSARAIDATDPAKGVVGVIEDITAERKAMAEMHEARLLAEDATRMKSEFLANMSHEIRTPMNAVLGMLFLALKNDLPAALRNQLVKAQAAAHSLLGVINDILDFSKIEAGRLELESVEFGLDSVLEQLMTAIGNQAEEKGIEFLIRYDVAMPPLLVGDPLRLAQVFINLCGNAVKFTETGEVELAFRCLHATDDELSIQVSVRDTGIGMSPEVQSRLFEKFTQADQSTTRRFGGTGLGLAISKNLVDLMGGRIWVEDSQPGKGTTICFTARLKVAAEAQAQRLALVAQAGPLLQDIRVLVVDDSAVSREILSEMLRVFKLEVAVATNGMTALSMLEAASEHPFDLVLMDWRMPGMKGDETIRRIHDDAGIVKKPRIVMVTAYGRSDVMQRATGAGVDGFLIKPVSPSMLLDTILSVLGRGRLLSGPAAEQAAALRPLDTAGLFRGLHLLLVEDNDINREFATGLLRGEGIEVDEAENGAEALIKVQERDYDAVLMDIQMPVMGGLEATRCIRELARAAGGERYATLPIISMTALAMAEDADRSLAAGMNDHVTKPVAPDRLMAVLAKWVKLPLDRPSSATTATAPSVPAELPADLLALPSLQARDGILRIGGKAEAYRKQLRRFRERHADAVPRLQRLLVEDTLQGAADYCHALRGVCGNIGAMALHGRLSGIETELKQGFAPSAAALADIHGLLMAVMADIDSLDISIPPSAAPRGQPLDASRLEALLDSLRDALRSDLGAAEPLLSELRTGVAGSELETDIAAIAADVDVFAVDEALAQVQALAQRLNPARRENQHA